MLNAHHIEDEAEIVAQAGQLGKVTVSTNMAGRGTDIRLGEGVPELGGLHVICTEMHDSARIDRQLIGRCGRQGDPGTCRQYLALDDELLETGLGPKKGQEVRGHRRAARAASSTASAGSSARPRGRSSAATSATARRLMYFEKHRKKMQRQMGQDPYLDSPN